MCIDVYDGVFCVLVIIFEEDDYYDVHLRAPIHAIPHKGVTKLVLKAVEIGEGLI